MYSSSGSSTVTMTTGNSSLSNSQQLSSSISSISPSRRSSSEVSKAYKHASQLFVTRRFPEALSVLDPIITPPKQANEHTDGEDEPLSNAPIGTATRNQRIKVWVLYITLLNEIVDLGQDEGKRCFGQARYKEMVNQVRNGDIWGTVVRNGYRGKEGSVDPDVVYNLATLLLGHAQSQAVTQSRLETYLASSSRADFDIAQQVDRETSHRANSHTNGTETPKDLASQLRIVELFALHVLPRNEEWEYARSFISMSDMLDDERRETFLQSLQELKDVREYEMKEQASILEHESDLPVQELSEVKNQIEAKNSTPKPSAAEQSGRGHQRTSSEVDYGIEKKQPNSNSLPGPKTEKPVTRASKVTPAAVSSGLYSSSSAGISRNGKVRKPSQKQSPAYLQQVRNLFRVMQNLVRNMATAIGANPTVLLQMLLSALAIIMAFSRRDIRERANRVLANGWNRVRGTVRMGVKVSYI